VPKTEQKPNVPGVAEGTHKVCATCDTWDPTQMECRAALGHACPPTASCAGWTLTSRKDYWSSHYARVPDSQLPEKCFQCGKKAHWLSPEMRGVCHYHRGILNEMYALLKIPKQCTPLD